MPQSRISDYIWYAGNGTKPFIDKKESKTILGNLENNHPSSPEEK